SNRQLASFKFRRQHPLGTCIVDFYCAEVRLVIEVDGDVHLGQAEADADRSQELETQGYRVLRFNNEEVATDLEGVLSAIQAACQSKAPLPDLGEGLG
ncbi:MAG: endonuclease domain-containing protein, partial [Anaerolineales bacterium]